MQTDTLKQPLETKAQRRRIVWKTPMKVIAIGAPITIALSLLCIFCIDLPLSLWIHKHALDTYPWMLNLLSTPIVISPAAAIYVLVYVIRRHTGDPGRNEHIAFIVSTTLLVSLQIKEMLKIAFGRTWPRHVVNPGTVPTGPGCAPSSLGYVNDGIHAFHAFGGSGKAFQAFPSGSTIALLAVAVPLMVLYPRVRPVLLIFTLVSLVAFILTNTHFLGDVVAGTYVGLVAGMTAVALVRERLDY
jgi:hypothetical protein